MIGQLMLSLSILIVLHEMGHFFPARWFNTRVEKFYLFFDPWFELFKIKKGDTEYGIGWLPLGGYVKISGMIDESMDKEQMKQPPQPWEFRSKPAWQRLIIMLGGVTVNFILGFLIYGMVLWVWGEKYLPTDRVQAGIYADSLGVELGLRTGDRIVSINGKEFEEFGESMLRREIIINDAKALTVRRDGQEVRIPIDPKWVSILSSYENKNKGLFDARTPFVVTGLLDDGPAEKAGVKILDKVVGIDSVRVEYFDEFVRYIADKPERPVTLIVERPQRDTLDYDGAKIVRIPLSTTPEAKIGAQRIRPMDYFGFERRQYSLGEALPAGVTKGIGFLSDQMKAFGQIFRGKIKATEGLGGFGSIAGMFGTTWDWERFWMMTAILSLILAFMNLLPIPALDGGHVMFLLYEVVTGRKPSDRFMEIATMVGFALVLGLVIFANGLDVLRGCS